MDPAALLTLREIYADRLQEQVPLAGYTSARIGGPSDALLIVRSMDELASAVQSAWDTGAPFLVLGSGSNLLVSDRGVRGLVIINRARQTRFDERSDPPLVWAESGANFGVLARQAAQRGLSGLEWAAGIPGTLGGAVIGNAGAHGGELAQNLRLAEILHRMDTGRVGEPLREEWPVEKLEFTYRRSLLKRNPGKYVVLAGLLQLQRGDPQAIREQMDGLVAFRRRTQPPGASTGSMFKNPPGGYAGRLIEEAGLKGTRVGGAEISRLHANFFINLGQASAADMYSLICLARERVAAQFGVTLELEIGLVGEW
jgi:UDP-N-acetylmuramate dehydrogenase